MYTTHLLVYLPRNPLLCSLQLAFSTWLRLTVRFSGRVHEAAITSVDEDRLIVAVEWFENGETKGKEVSKYPTVYTVLVSRNIVGLYLELSWLEVLIVC